MTPVLVPELGLSIEETIQVGCWLVEPGDEVVEGDRLVELWIGEITFDVSSPATGRLQRILLDTEEPVAVGAVLGEIEEETG